ncbi:hypothetical protein IMSAG025_00596 [Muribaculaceae bacterium]|nr:hypothetical protein IMSAG025_00596 [Muribaculaceae bacterium]
MASQEAKALCFFFQKHLSKVTMSKANLTGISNRTRDTESLKALTDCCSSIRSFFAAFLDCDSCAYNICPAGIFKADRLNAFYLVINIKPSIFCDFFSFFDRRDSVAVQYGINFINSSFI